MKRLGALIKFKPGVTKEKAAMALKAIQAVLDVPETTTRYVPAGTGTGRSMRSETVPFKSEHLVHEYEDEHGGPVWYIP